MQTTYNQPDISLTYVNGGLDRYGQVVNHSWVKNSGALVHIVHGYDYADNRLYRNDLVQLANSELYSYDNLGQIKMLRRGALNADQTSVPTVNHSEAWNFDKSVCVNLGILGDIIWRQAEFSFVFLIDFP